MRLIKAALCFSFITGIAAAQAPRARVDFGAFDAYVARTAREWQVPALAIAIVKDDSLVFAKGFGVLETGKATPADAHTRFAVGSTFPEQCPKQILGRIWEIQLFGYQFQQ